MRIPGDQNIAGAIGLAAATFCVVLVLHAFAAAFWRTALTMFIAGLTFIQFFAGTGFQIIVWIFAVRA